MLPTTQRTTKLADILDTIEAAPAAEGASGAVVYCATRSATERVAEFLKQQGLAAERFHAGIDPEEKREIQEQFHVGELRVIAATNAFGMGIDKPDIRLVVHGDMPGSLENYLQEAGRAGRDRDPANCVLLFNTEDVERQFSLSARSRLARHEIGAILKGAAAARHPHAEGRRGRRHLGRDRARGEGPRVPARQRDRRHAGQDGRRLAGRGDAAERARKTGCRSFPPRCG